LQPFLDIKTAQPVQLVARGKSLYDANCGACHTIYGEGSVYPDLRRMSRGVYGSFSAIVLGGALRNFGMESFADTLAPGDVDAIRAYITDWAQRSESSQTQ
jgi:mono/diheme cytochrome c family protein